MSQKIEMIEGSSIDPVLFKTIEKNLRILKI